ncbi:MAG: response regulator [Ignavibacteriales bacterium]|nr:response regulator [Ignavibacteriales bacterium]
MDKSAENKGVILVIDDEVTFVQAAMLALEMEGYTVLKAHDGIQGLVVFTQHQHLISLVLCDLNMPHQDGDSTVQKILALKPSLKVIVMSGSIDDESLPSIIHHPSCLYLQKPFSVQTLIESVEKMVGYIK